jgi:YD repeat-containing protein
LEQDSEKDLELISMRKDMREENNLTATFDGQTSEIAVMNAQSRKNVLRRVNYPLSLIVLLLFLTNAFGQQTGNENSADRVLRGSGRVNASSLGMEFDLPLGGYPGRGIDVPVSLSYSSKVWRNKPYFSYEYIGPGANSTFCIPSSEMKFAEDTASGWTSSLAVPYIEYTGVNTVFNHEGFPISFTDVECPLSGGGGGGSYPNTYIKRLVIHLPGGGSHEFRADDTIYPFTIGSTGSDSPSYAPNWDTTFYAVGGSNMKYVQDSSLGIYRLWMPDGSFYDFNASSAHGADRKATRFTDRNGNYTSFYGPNSVDENNVTHPNGYWKDTLGRIISIPVGLAAPTSPTTAQTPQLYSLPGMSEPYKLQWKRLKGGSPEESAFLNTNENPRYIGNRRLYWGGNHTEEDLNDDGTYLFQDNGEYNSLIQGGNEIFNPIVLTEVELPNGQKYQFKYDEFGRIVKIIYPTGGEEIFTYQIVPTLSKLELGADSGKANHGVTNRKVLKYAGDTNPYEWTYSAAYASTSTGYRVTITNPDGTKTERYLHRGTDSDVIVYHGYDNPLAGMPYEERTFNDAGSLVARKLTHWKLSSFTGGWQSRIFTAGWHPRIDHEESYVYDSTGNGVYGTTKTEYEDEANLTRQSPILAQKVSQYAFVTTSGGSITPGASPAPTPITTPGTPPTLLRTAESTFLFNDSSVTNRQSYKDRNMVELVSASVVKDETGTTVSRNEIKYDDSGYSPTNYVRGNPTALGVWDSAKGGVSDPAAYIFTRAKFDTYGNQYEGIDANGASTLTEFDATYHAFPIKVTSAVPDPNNTHGSNTPFITTATFDPITGLPIKTKDANGLETRTTYDPATLRLLNTKTFYLENQVGSMSETIYHDEPNNSWVKSRTQIDAGIWAESITYFDGLGRAYKTEEINSEGSIFVEKEFDQDGRVKRVTNPFRTGETKKWTTNVYDGASRIKEVITADGAKVKTDYGVATAGSNVGTVITVTDQAGKMRRSITNALGQLTRVDEPNLAGQLDALDTPHQPTYYSYNTQGDLISVNQGNQTRTFSYSSLSRLLSATNAESGTISYTYDQNGNLKTKRDARDIKTIYDYDALDRVVTRCYKQLAANAALGSTTCANNNETPEANTPSVSYTYDSLTNAKGKLIKVENGYSKTEYTEFDILGRVKKSKQTTDANSAEMEYTYNMSGALIEQKYPSGRVVRNVLDNNGNLSKVQSRKSSGGAFWNYARNFTYTAARAVSSIELGNFLWESTIFNSRLQPEQIGLGRGKHAPNTTNPATDLLDLDYQYGEPLSNGTVDAEKNNGNIAKQTITVQTIGSNPGFTAVQTYTYDSLNRLHDVKENIDGSTTPEWKQTFSYDRFGNRSFDEANTTADLLKFPKECGIAPNKTMCAADKKIF